MFISVKIIIIVNIMTNRLSRYLLILMIKQTRQFIGDCVRDV